jgi:ferritin-like metal-binding protein YciE
MAKTMPNDADDKETKPSAGEAKSKGFGQSLSDTVRVVGRLLKGEINVEFDSLSDLFLKELQDLYAAEKQLLVALPQMADAAGSQDLQAAFREHLEETRTHLQRLDQVFEELNVQPERKPCKAMEGLICEAHAWIAGQPSPGVMDAGLIAVAQPIEHYEIAGYGCVRTYADLLGYRAIVPLLQTTLNEEGAADKKLTQLARRINVLAKKAK